MERADATKGLPSAPFGISAPVGGWLRGREEFDKIQVFLRGESLEGMIDFLRGVREGVLEKIGAEVLLRLGRVE